MVPIVIAESSHETVTLTTASIAVNNTKLDLTPGGIKSHISDVLKLLHCIFTAAGEKSTSRTVNERANVSFSTGPRSSVRDSGGVRGEIGGEGTSKAGGMSGSARRGLNKGEDLTTGIGLVGRVKRKVINTIPAQNGIGTNIDTIPGRVVAKGGVRGN
jgi:hypothetical protein